MRIAHGTVRTDHGRFPAPSSRDSAPCRKKLLPFILFAIAGAITPGPNNMISTASGAAFGFLRTVPQMLGVAVGFPLMILALGLGFGEVFRHAPWLHEVLRYAGAAFLLYLAWRMARPADSERAEAKRPLTVLEAAQRHVVQIPSERLTERATPGRDRSIRDLAYHVYQVPDAFLQAVESGVRCSFSDLTVSFTSRPASTAASLARSMVSPARSTS
jgi:hypothetical protein